MVEMDQPKVSKLENGRQLPSVEDIDAWAAATGADPAGLHEVRRRAVRRDMDILEASRTPGGVEALQGQLEELEAGSQLIAEYQPFVIPGLAQTPAYTRAWLTQPRPTVVATQEIEAKVAGRLARQERARGGGKQIVVAVNEAALQASYGDPEVLEEQVRKVREMAAVGEIELLIEPLTQPMAVLHGFELLDDAVFVETVYGGRILTDPSVVERFADALDRLRP